MSLPWYIEYWYILPSTVAIFVTIILPFIYVRRLRKTEASEPKELMQHLATFYKVLAVACFIPIVSPSSWVGVDMAYAVLPIIFPSSTGSEGRAGGGAGIALLLMFCLLFSSALCLLCYATAMWILQRRGKVLGLFVSILFVASGIFALISLYPNFLMALHDFCEVWALLYVLANLSQITMNLVSIFYLVRPRISKHFIFRSGT